MKKQVGIICHYCGAKVLKDLTEWSRNQKKGRHCFCSISCAISYKNKTTDWDKEKLLNNFKGSKQNGRIKDEFSPFRPHLKNIRNHLLQRDRYKTREINITLQDLKNQWDKQNGICPYTGVKLENYTGSSNIPKASPYRASVDRIDNSKGYEVGNIEFVSLMAQYAKNRFSKEELIEFCKQVATNHNT